MMTIVIAIAVFMLAVLGLGAGLLARRRPLGRSCGNCTECLLRRAAS